MQHPQLQYPNRIAHAFGGFQWSLCPSYQGSIAPWQHIPAYDTWIRVPDGLLHWQPLGFQRKHKWVSAIRFSRLLMYYYVWKARQSRLIILEFGAFLPAIYYFGKWLSVRLQSPLCNCPNGQALKSNAQTPQLLHTKVPTPTYKHPNSCIQTSNAHHHKHSTHKCPMHKLHPDFYIQTVHNRSV